MPAQGWFVGRGFSRDITGSKYHGLQPLKYKPGFMGRIARRVRQPGVYFVTTDTWLRRSLFNKTDPARILLDQILDCRARGFYKLHCFVIMPEHLHLLITPGNDASLEKAMQMIKGGSAYAIRKQLGYTFPVWHSGYHDRWIRNGAEYSVRKAYIDLNPVKARLVQDPKAYVWGSACGNHQLDPSRLDE